MSPLLLRSAVPLARDACAYHRSNPHIRPNQTTMKFEPSASSALWPPMSRSKLAPSAGPYPLRIGDICVYVRRAPVDARRTQIDSRDEASTTLVGITYNWWRRQACLPFGPNQSKTLLAPALDLAAMDGSLHAMLHKPSARWSVPATSARHSRAASRPTRPDSTEIQMTTARPPC